MELAAFFLRHDSGRALRVGMVFGGALMICHALGWRNEAIFAAMAAQNIALPDLRGAYRMRLAIIGTMLITITAACMTGMLVGNSVIFSTAAMGVIALFSGAWRHLSADYGPALGISSALFFLFGIAYPGDFQAALHTAGVILVGGAGAALCHIILWPFRPQHPLRFAVAESWVALADLIGGMRPSFSHSTVSEHDKTIMEREQDLRATLDRTFVILGAAKARHHSALLLHLETMRREVVHLAVRVTALNTALEELAGRPNFSTILPAIDSMLKELSDAARSIAITLITHRLEKFAVPILRLHRCGGLIRVLNEQIVAMEATADPGILQIQSALARIEQGLPQIRERLEETLKPNSAGITFPMELPELGALPARSLSAWINRAPQLDPMLIRYALRMAFLTMLAVAFYKGLHIPRGYWIVFTIVVVLQPDYGSTRQRAAQRIGGTVAGSLLGSVFIWIPMPLYVLDSCAALMAFLFAYFLRTRYGLAVFFVTLLVVLMTETMMPVALDFTVERLVATLTGGVAALACALLFWPIWECDKFTGLLAAAVRANRLYLETLAAARASGADIEDWLMAKRRAENANRHAAASLQRLLGEPGGRCKNPQRSTALMAYNQRLTRALSALGVDLRDEIHQAAQLDMAVLAAFGAALETMESAIKEEFSESAMAEAAAQVRKLENVPPGNPLAKCILEIRAMAFA